MIHTCLRLWYIQYQSHSKDIHSPFIEIYIVSDSRSQIVGIVDPEVIGQNGAIGLDADRPPGRRASARAGRRVCPPDRHVATDFDIDLAAARPGSRIALGAEGLRRGVDFLIVRRAITDPDDRGVSWLEDHRAIINIPA